MAAAGTSETLVPFYQTNEKQIPENSIPHLNSIYILNVNVTKIRFNNILLSTSCLNSSFLTKTFNVFLASSILENKYITVQKYKKV
jgi:hypothetical protein